MKRRGRNIALISAASVAFILIVLFFVFLYTPSCMTKTCLIDSLKTCSRSVSVYENENALWQYTILFSFGDQCRINVRAVGIKADAEASNLLSGKEMLCSIPKGSAVDFPEKSLESCHGDLKESMQDLMIKRMQLYIINALKANSTK